MDGTRTRDGHGLACAVAISLGDLLVYRGDEAVAAAALLIALDPQIKLWYCEMVNASQPPRAVAAASYLLYRLITSGCSFLGVSVSHNNRTHPRAAPARGTRPRHTRQDV